MVPACQIAVTPAAECLIFDALSFHLSPTYPAAGLRTILRTRTNLPERLKDFFVPDHRPTSFWTNYDGGLQIVYESPALKSGFRGIIVKGKIDRQ